MIVIIGNGVAGHSCATTIRSGCEEEITMITNENDSFYDRVGLKKYPEGKVTRNSLMKANLPFYRENKIDLMLNSIVTGISTSEKVVFVGEKRVEYDDLVIASGVRPVKVFENEPENVYYLWNLKDGDRMNRELKKGQKGVVIGGGLLAIDIANIFSK